MTDLADDPFRWLEDPTGEVALRWVRERNDETLAARAGTPGFERLRTELREVLDAQERLPMPAWHGGHLYNFWQDVTNPRGLWRRTTPIGYRQEEPDWEVLLDLDELAESEGENWVWKGAVLRPTDYRRALISLSRGGSDACVVREYDLGSGFLADGFTLPEAKTDVDWIDDDRIYVSTDFGPGTLTSAGYPRIIKEWRRGTPLESATVVFEGQPGDVIVSAQHDETAPEFRSLILRYIDFFRSEKYLRTGTGDLIRLAVPDDATVDTHRDWLLIRLRSEWTVGGETHPDGALLGTRVDAFLASHSPEKPLVHRVFTPDARTALSYHSWTRDHLILTMLTDVSSRLEIVRPETWAPLAAAASGAPTAAGSFHPGFTHTDVIATNRRDGDEYMLMSSGFTEPATLCYGQVAGGSDASSGVAQPIRQEPAFFDATGISVDQYFATSADGTRVPYFVVGHRGAPAPTLLTGYGGFQVPRTPGYNGLIGRGWLGRGGTYALANIRGGGEYGPAWHRSAIGARRHRAYEDFAAVASDLVDRGITTHRQLGIEGTSNGGLLMGVMLTQYPALFGAVVGQVPLMDMLRFHELLAGASWIAEYGDPDDPADRGYLREYSPYHNVYSGQPYPPVLLVTSTKDDRVHPGHARKMAARLRQFGYDVTYYENIEGGHGAAANNEQMAFRWALVLDFLWQHLAGGRPT